VRKLTKQEVAAMWLFSSEYADKGISAIDFYESLPNSKKTLVKFMLSQIKEAGEKGNDMTKPDELIEKMATAFNKNFPSTDGAIREIFIMATNDALKVVLAEIQQGGIVDTNYKDDIVLQLDYQRFLEGK
jgi:hypothetical protein